MKKQILNHEKTEADMDCGGKRSAPPLSHPSTPLADNAKALSPLRSASALYNLPGIPDGARGATRPASDESTGHKQATGKSPEPAGRNACPTLVDDVEQLRGRSLQTATRERGRGGLAERSELVAMLDNYGLAVAGFDSLRKDAYEKQVAAVSLEDLERVYEALLDPALGFKEVRERCPVWPAGSRLAGKMPSMMTLREIKERILLEWSVQDRIKHSDFLKQIQEVGLDSEQFMDAAGLLLGAELFSAKLDGKLISDNLRVFDRLLRVVGIQLRLRKEKREQDKRRDAENAEGKAPKSNLQAPENGAKAEFGKRKAETEANLTTKSTVDAMKAGGLAKPARGPMIGGNARPTMQGGHHKTGIHTGGNLEVKNEVILETGYEPLDWLPGIKDRDGLKSLVEMVMGGPS
jgi:hypothetical protein